jgi:hypothetical protein
MDKGGRHVPCNIKSHYPRGAYLYRSRTPWQPPLLAVPQALSPDDLLGGEHLVDWPWQSPAQWFECQWAEVRREVDSPWRRLRRSRRCKLIKAHKSAFLGGIRSISVAIQFLETRGQTRAHTYRRQLSLIFQPAMARDRISIMALTFPCFNMEFEIHRRAFTDGEFYKTVSGV